MENSAIAKRELLDRLVEALDVADVLICSQLICSGVPPRSESFQPDRFWAIQVMPSFANPGLFAVMESRSLVRCAFVCKGDAPDDPNADYAVADCLVAIADWHDPVLTALNFEHIAPLPDRSLPEGQFLVSSDGIGYELTLRTLDVDARLAFSNPRPGPYRRLEKAALEVASGISRRIRHPQVSSFIKTWREYVRAGE